MIYHIDRDIPVAAEVEEVHDDGDGHCQQTPEEGGLAKQHYRLLSS